MLSLVPLPCESNFDSCIIEDALTILRDSTHLGYEVLLVALLLLFRRGNLHIVEHAVVLKRLVLVLVDTEGPRVIGTVHTLEDLVLLC